MAQRALAHMPSVVQGATWLCSSFGVAGCCGCPLQPSRSVCYAYPARSATPMMQQPTCQNGDASTPSVQPGVRPQPHSAGWRGSAPATAGGQQPSSAVFSTFGGGQVTCWLAAAGIDSVAAGCTCVLAALAEQLQLVPALTAAGWGVGVAQPHADGVGAWLLCRQGMPQQGLGASRPRECHCVKPCWLVCRPGLQLGYCWHLPGSAKCICCSPVRANRCCSTCTLDLPAL
jgi:hypothetical protein